MLFVQQKTAYERGIINWSSDGCSSVLDRAEAHPRRLPVLDHRWRRPAGVGGNRDRPGLLARARGDRAGLPVVALPLCTHLVPRPRPRSRGPARMNDVLARLRPLQAAAPPLHRGRTLPSVYQPGLTAVHTGARPARAATPCSNALHPPPLTPQLTR